MNWKLCAAFLLTMLLSGCKAVNLHHSTATPIPEKPLTEMISQPPDGVSGADSIGDQYILTLGNTGYDVQQYNLVMEFSSQVDVITATVTITSVVTLDHLGRISLDFNGYQVDGVQVGDQYAPYYRSPNKLYIDLPESFAVGKELVVQVRYHGQVAPVESPYIHALPLGLRTFKGKNITYAFGEPDGSHDWYPCNDHPLDKAVYHFELTVPIGLTAIANGTLLTTIPSINQVTYIWSETAPMATYLATVLVGDYQRIEAPAVGNVKIRHYIIAGDFDFSTELAKTQSMLEFYSKLIGPYSFDEFGYVIIINNEDQALFGEETQTMVMVDRRWMFGQSVEGLLAHEMVHQWFGDSVSLSSWNEVWLKEGLATYLMVLWLDHQGYVDIPTMMDDLEGELTTDSNQNIQPLNQPKTSDMYGSNTYDKGAWVFYMLRQEIGNQNFTKFLQEYYRRYAGGNATTADLQAVAEDVSGMDLNAFFQQWVYGPGIPDLHVTWNTQPDSVTVQVCQASSGQVYTIPLEIQLNANDGKSEQEVIQVDQSQEQVTYSLPFSITAVEVDPGEKLLADVHITRVNALTACAP